MVTISIISTTKRVVIKCAHNSQIQCTNLMHSELISDKILEEFSNQNVTADQSWVPDLNILKLQILNNHCNSNKHNIKYIQTRFIRPHTTPTSGICFGKLIIVNWIILRHFEFQSTWNVDGYHLHMMSGLF